MSESGGEGGGFLVNTMTLCVGQEEGIGLMLGAWCLMGEGEVESADCPVLSCPVFPCLVWAVSNVPES